MKKSTWVTGFAVVVLALSLAAPAVAQQSTYTIQVPFPFMVGVRSFPAGEYRVGHATTGVITIRGVDSTMNAVFATTFVGRSNGQPLNADLVFRQYGQQYFLGQVWFEDVKTGYQLFVSRNERDYAKQSRATTTVLRAGK